MSSGCHECDQLSEVFNSPSQKKNNCIGSSSSHWAGLVLAGVTGGTAVLLSVVAAPFVAPALRRICLPYVPATPAQVHNVIQALKGAGGTTLVDLGSGDGRLVIAASKQLSLRSTGVELNPWLVLYSRFRAWREGVHTTTSFRTADLWKLDLKEYHNVIIFGVEEMMAPLEHKLSKELPPGGVVVACRFPLPSWTPHTTLGSGIDSVWLYSVGGRNGGDGWSYERSHDYYDNMGSGTTRKEVKV